ncbi:MAG TPA: YceI family protein [Steroidobacteraceae bacterium]|nr:YceI family protein [Steroidobacteraceae bacterium]
MFERRWGLLLVLLVVPIGNTPVWAEPVSYTIDPEHTYPSFEAPHIAGISIWRGKLEKTSGSIVLDRQAHTGHLEVVMDAASIDFGHPGLNAHVKTADFFDVAKYPTITYKADTIKFQGDTPTEIDGILTMHGVSRPVALKVNEFKCIIHPMLKREVCGADASAQLNRSDFGLAYGVSMTGDWVRLAIQVEARKDQKAAGS